MKPEIFQSLRDGRISPNQFICSDYQYAAIIISGKARDTDGGILDRSISPVGG
jgi:hypothetical protein